jgi:hypothetical protein
MTQMAIAATATDLSAHHPVAVILDVSDMVGVEWFKETRPAGAGFKLGSGFEQRQPA